MSLIRIRKIAAEVKAPQTMSHPFAVPDSSCWRWTSHDQHHRTPFFMNTTRSKNNPVPPLRFQLQCSQNGDLKSRITQLLKTILTLQIGEEILAVIANDPCSYIGDDKHQQIQISRHCWRRSRTQAYEQILRRYSMNMPCSFNVEVRAYVDAAASHESSAWSTKEAVAARRWSSASISDVGSFCNLITDSRLHFGRASVNVLP